MRKQLINPYEVTYVPEPALAPRKGIWVDGNFLVVPHESVLPMRCVLTNQPVEISDVTTREFQWAPSFHLVLTRDRCKVTYGVNRRYRRNAFASRLVLLAVMVCFTWIFFGFCSIVFSLSVGASLILNPTTPLKIVRASQGQFWISGCSQAFLESIEQPASIVAPT